MLGMFRERVLIKTGRTTTVGETGDAAFAYGTQITVSAMVDAKSGGEEYKGGRVRGFNRYVITTHFRSDLSSATEIEWRGRTLDVSRVWDDDLKRQFIKLEAIERDDQPES